jgi:hypothetical protein
MQEGSLKNQGEPICYQWIMETKDVAVPKSKKALTSVPLRPMPEDSILIRKVNPL